MAGIIREQNTENNNILMCLEYLVRRLSARHAVFIDNEKGFASISIGNQMPTNMSFKTDVLHDSIKAVLAEYLPAAKKDYESHKEKDRPVNHIYLKLQQLNCLVDSWG